MYQPAHFEESRIEVLHELIRAQSLGTLITLNEDGLLQANLLPFLIDAEPAPRGTLRGHVARANSVWRETRADVPALVVFQGPQAYISPSWYPSKAATGKVVPTWNYVVVQARGMLRWVDDRDWLRGFVGRLTHRFESPRARPWKVEDAPSDYIDAMLHAIVGFEIEITSLAGKWKASQNRPADDREGVITGLREWAGVSGDAQALAMAETVMDRHQMQSMTKTQGGDRQPTIESPYRQEHRLADYHATVHWQRDGQSFVDNRYSRRHVWHFDGGASVIASSSPHVVPLPWSDPAGVDPEEAFVASLSSCHMLFFLSLAAKAGWQVDDYRDDAVGVMARNADGKLAMTRVTLRPAVVFDSTKRPGADELARLHHEAHDACFIANSVHTEVRCEPIAGG